MQRFSMTAALLAAAFAVSACDDGSSSAEGDADGGATTDATAGGDSAVGSDASSEDSGATADAAALAPDAFVLMTERPSKRSEFSVAADPSSNQIVLFGGDDGPFTGQVPRPNFLDATWIFEPGVGWTELELDVKPSPRGRAAVAYDPNGKRMLLFGGRYRDTGASGNYDLPPGLWAFDFTSRTWQQLHDGTGDGPSPRYFATAAYDPSDDTFYVYGGGANRDPLRLTPVGDTWAFKDGQWTEVETSGEVPPTRMFMGYTYDSQRNRLIMFGGQPGDFVSPAMNDLYALDLSTREWHRLDTAFTRPAQRFRTKMAYDADRDRYLLFGGHLNAGDANDVWAFDPQNQTWSEVRPGDTFTGNNIGCVGNPSEVPKDYVDADLTAPERRSGGGFVILGEKAWVVLGENGECSDHLDDLWTYDLATDDWTEVVPARSGESCERRGDDCACLCL